MSKTTAQPPFGKPRLHAKDAQPAANRNGRSFGVTSGLQRTDFIVELLYANYRRQKTDHELAAELKAEFPNSDEFQPIKKYRQYFNSALPQHGQGIGRRLSGTEKLPEFGNGRGCVSVGAPTPQPTLASLQRPKKHEKQASARRRSNEPTKQQNDLACVAAIEGLLQ
jgi:hypothetical protein